MKKLITIFVFYLSPCFVFAQNGSLESVMRVNTKVAYPSFKEKIKEASDYYSCENYRGNGICFGNLKGALQLDVFEYYSLDDRYSTELQKENFKRTQEYKEKLGELTSIRGGYLEMPLYIELNNSEEFQISDYNLKDGGFYIRTGIKLIPSEFSTYNKYYDLKPLPIKTNISAYYHPSINPQKLYDRYLFLPISRDVAPQIEQHRDQIKCIAFFNPLGITKRDNGFLGYDYFATTDIVRLIVINQETSEIYFDKLYSAIKKNTKIKK